MKKFLLFLFVLTMNNCFAATGSAYDGILFMGAIIAIMLLFLGTGYFIDFVKSRIKEARTKKMVSREIEKQEDQINDLLNEALAAN